jgi:quinol monooxygenase YgiN
MIVVTGAIVARPDTRDALIAKGIEHSQRSRAEPGCLDHNIHVDCENPMRVVFIERWADRAALKAHFMVPASGAFVREAAGLAAGKPTIEIYDTADLTHRDIMA